MMGKRKISKENRVAMVAAYRARIASLSPEERKAMAARLNTPEIIAGRHQMMLDRWAKRTPEERVKACAHLTTPEMQAKSHAAQLTPEFRARRSELTKAALARKTPEERAAIEAKRQATIAAWTPEEREAFREKARAAIAARTPEEWEAVIAKRRATIAARTPEEQEAITAKWRASFAQGGKRNCATLTYNGKTQTIAEWSAETGLPVHVIANRRVQGWAVERIFTTPVKAARKRLQP